MHCLRLFIVVLPTQCLQLLLWCVCMCIPSFVLIGYCVSDLHGHICPEAVFLLFYKNYIVYKHFYMFMR